MYPASLSVSMNDTSNYVNILFLLILSNQATCLTEILCTISIMCAFVYFAYMLIFYSRPAG